MLLKHSVLVLVKLKVLIVDPETGLDREPVLQGIVHIELLLSEFVKFCKDGRRQHILNLYLASALGVKEEEKFSYCCDHIERVKSFLKTLQLRECWHQLEDIILKVFFFQIAEARRIVE